MTEAILDVPLYEFSGGCHIQPLHRVASELATSGARTSPPSSYVSFLTPPTPELGTVQPQKTSSRASYAISKRSRISADQSLHIFQRMCVIIPDRVRTGYQLDTRDILASILFPQLKSQGRPSVTCIIYIVYLKDSNRNLHKQQDNLQTGEAGSKPKVAGGPSHPGLNWAPTQFQVLCFF